MTLVLAFILLNQSGAPAWAYFAMAALWATVRFVDRAFTCVLVQTLLQRALTGTKNRFTVHPGGKDDPRP